MQCDYFGECGGCSLGKLHYDEQLEYKIEIEKERFSVFAIEDFDIIKSEQSHFRNRAEFRLFKTYEKDNKFQLDYAMTAIDKSILKINSCPIVVESIYNLMPNIKLEIEKNEILHNKIFSIEFLSSKTNDILVTLIYHRQLDEEWKHEALKLSEKLKIKIIGRSRKQKEILSVDYIYEELSILNKAYKFYYKEGGFTQPNQVVNEKMIEWVISNIRHEGDLCELYCGGGNFTIPLGDYFTNVLATEVSKTSILSAKKNCEINNSNNINFVRLSAEEFVQAKNNIREFRRLQQENIKINNYNFSTVFVDPPRAGLDEHTRELVKEFDQIVYISCNPETLFIDLQSIHETHVIKKFAFFDQFAYTKHIESGVILEKNV